MNVSGDGYITCSQGHLHWGKYGAAGLLVFTKGEDGLTRYLLQKRSPNVHMGGTWSTPGGAIHYGEHPVDGAKREAIEELGGEHIASLWHTTTLVNDHGGWVYYTILMKSPSAFTTGPGADHAAWESEGTAWFTAEEMQSLPLHPGFAATLSQSLEAAERAE